MPVTLPPPDHILQGVMVQWPVVTFMPAAGYDPHGTPWPIQVDAQGRVVCAPPAPEPVTILVPPGGFPSGPGPVR